MHFDDERALRRCEHLRVPGVTWTGAQCFDPTAYFLGRDEWRRDGYHFVSVATDGTGSTWCLWLGRDDGARAPVVLFESEGRCGLVAAHVDDLLDRADRALPDVGPADDPFRDWVARQFAPAAPGEMVAVAWARGDYGAVVRIGRASLATGWEPGVHGWSTLGSASVRTGHPATFAGPLRAAWRRSDKQCVPLAAALSEVLRSLGDEPEPVEVLSSSPSPDHWRLYGWAHHDVASLFRADEAEWGRFTEAYELEDEASVREALQLIDADHHPGWAARMEGILSVLVHTAPQELRRCLKEARSEEEEALAHAKLGLALAEAQPDEAYAHLESAVLSLPGASMLGKRCMEVLEHLEE